MEQPSAAARETKLLKVCDGLTYSLQMLRLSYEPLWAQCREIRSKASKAIEAMQGCWAFIDSVHRLRELAQAIPTINAKHPEIRAFLSATEVAEEFRHYIQHLRKELNAPQEIPSPVWGALSWVDGEKPNVSHTAFLGTDIHGTTYTSLPWDRLERRFVSKVSLGLGNKTLSFDELYEAAIRFERFVEEHVKPKRVLPPQPNGLPIISYELKEVEGGYEVGVSRGLVVPAGMTASPRAPDIAIPHAVDEFGTRLSLHPIKKP